MRIQPVLPIFRSGDRKFKKPIDKQRKKEYNTKQQRQFEIYLKECMNNESNQNWVV